MSNVRQFPIPSGLDIPNTVRGAKMPLMIGPTEMWWSTRTPDGLGSLHLQRESDTKMTAEAWGPGAEWLLDQAPKLLGAEDTSVSDFQPEGVVRQMWRRKPFLLSRTDRPWDAVVAGVFGQKVQTQNAKKARKQLARNFGDPAPGPENPYGRRGWILPGPDVVADMAYHDFHRLGVERKRAETLIRTAREMRRTSDLTSSRTPTEVKTRLERIRGIGPWTTNMVTAMAMGDSDAVPVGDYHIPNTVAWVLAKEPRASDERMLELLEPYAGHRWRVIRLLKGSESAPKYGPRLSLSGDGLHMGR